MNIKNKLYITVPDYNPKAIEELITMGFEVNISQNGKDYIISNLLNHYDALIIGIKDKIDSSIYNTSLRCKFIGTLSVGIDHIKDLVNIDGLTIKNIEGYNSQSVSEFIWGQLISIMRGIYLSNFSGKARPKGTRLELSGKKIGVIGAGNIGTKVLMQAKTFNMERYSYTLNPQNHQILQEEGVTFVNLEQLLKISDIIVLTIPSNHTTYNMINKNQIELMKKGAYFISTSRLNTFDINSLVTAVKQDKLGGVALDIDKNELEIDTNNLNILITPHLAGISSDANDKADFIMKEEVSNHFKNKWTMS